MSAEEEGVVDAVAQVAALQEKPTQRASGPAPLEEAPDLFDAVAPAPAPGRVVEVAEGARAGRADGRTPRSRSERIELGAAKFAPTKPPPTVGSALRSGSGGRRRFPTMKFRFPHVSPLGWLLLASLLSNATDASSPSPSVESLRVRFQLLDPFGPPSPEMGTNYQFSAINGVTHVSPNLVIFRAYRDGAYGFDLWNADGRGAARKLMNASLGRNHGTADSGRATRLDDDRFFFAGQIEAFGEELYVTDGRTAEGSRLVMDVQPGAGSSMPRCFSVWRSRLYFEVFSSHLVRSLFETDGTTEGTREIWWDEENFFDCPYGFVNLRDVSPNLHGYTFFRADGRIHFTNGTTEGTRAYQDSDALGRQGRTFHRQLLDGKLLGAKGGNVYTIDCPSCAAALVTTVYPNDASKSVELGGIFRTPGTEGLAGGLFFVEGSREFLELWGTDGTAEGTRRLLSKVRTVPVGDGVVYVLSRGSIWLVDAIGGGSALLSDDALDKYGANIWADKLNETAMVYVGANQTLWVVSFERPDPPQAETQSNIFDAETLTPATALVDSSSSPLTAGPATSFEHPEPSPAETQSHLFDATTSTPAAASADSSSSPSTASPITLLSVTTTAPSNDPETTSSDAESPASGALTMNPAEPANAPIQSSVNSGQTAGGRWALAVMLTRSVWSFIAII
ncbi:hypothetical protein ACHAWF_015455 [Thalassiosira exigua]